MKLAAIFVAVFIFSPIVAVEGKLPCAKFNASPFPGGYIKKNGYLHNEEVTFGCSNPLVIDGQATLKCDNGAWSASLPRCGGPCKSLSPPKDGKIIKNGRQHKDKVVFSCDVGHRMIGSPERLCNFGVWSDAGKIPVCQVVTCIAQNIPTSSGVKAVVSGNTYGSVIKFSCQVLDYALSGKEIITCGSDGKWSNQVPKCLAPCQIVATSNLISKKKVYLHGEHAQIKCQSGFRLQGSRNFRPQCVNGQWTGTSFPCCAKIKINKKPKRRFFRKIRSWIKSKVRKIG